MIELIYEGVKNPCFINHMQTEVSAMDVLLTHLSDKYVQPCTLRLTNLQGLQTSKTDT